MDDDDDDYVPESDPDESPPSKNLRRRASSEIAEPNRKKKRKQNKTRSGRSSTSLPTNIRSISMMEKHVRKQLHGHDIDSNLSLRVVSASLRIQKNYLEAVRKIGQSKVLTIPKPAIRKTICETFSISERTYGNIMKQYLVHRQPYVSGKDMAGRSGNRCAKVTRIPDTKKIVIIVRDFVREKRKQRKRVTARQVLDLLVDKNILSIPQDPNKKYLKLPFESAYRSVRRWLHRHNYQRGRRTGNLVQKESIVLHRQIYLQRFFKNRAEQPLLRLREVMLDESYIHQHYHRNDDSIWDPGDEQDVQMSRAPAKGRRYCFAAAIQGPNPSINNPVLAVDKAGLVAGSVWAFCPQKSGDHKGDYHKVFNGENFTTWWKEQLLPNLHQPSLIMLDNAKYHCIYGSHIPKIHRMKKQDCINYLSEKGVAFPNDMLAIQLKKLVQEHIKQHEKYEIVRLAELQGHQVLFTPPYHSDFQPIELLWALIKGNVGRQYDDQTTLDTVYKRLMDEFEDVKTKHESITGMIEKCAETARKFYEELEDDDEDDFCCSDSSSSIRSDDEELFFLDDMPTDEY